MWWEWKILSTSQSGSISEITNLGTQFLFIHSSPSNLISFIAAWNLLMPLPSLCLFLLSLSFEVQLSFHGLWCQPFPWQYLKVPCPIILPSYQPGKPLMWITPTNHTLCTWASRSTGDNSLSFQEPDTIIPLSRIFLPSLSLDSPSFPTFAQDSPNKQT